MNDLVSLVMPIFDGARWLDESVSSVFAQTHRPLEWIAVDDGSSDASPACLSRLATRAAAHGVAVQRLRTDRLGVAGARNAGIAVAQGDVLAFLDQDDVLEPDYLARQLPLLAASPGRFVTSDLAWLGPSPDGLPTFPPAVESAPSTYEEAWLRIGIATPGTVVVRTADVVAVGGFPSAPEFAGADDRGLWLELVARGVLPVRNRFVGLHYRIHDAQASRGVRQKRAKVALFTAYAARGVREAVARGKLATLRLDLACDLLDVDPAEAVREAAEAFALSPAARDSVLGRAYRRKRLRKRIARLPIAGPALRAAARLFKRER